MKINYVLLFLFLMSTSFAFAQNSKRADKAYEAGEYYKAVEEYTLLQDQVTDPSTKSMIKFRLAESYRRMNRSEKAEKFYVDAIKSGYMSSEVYMGYGNVLLQQGKYEQAQKAFETYKRSNPSDKIVDTKLASCAYALANPNENPQFTLQPLEAINTRGSEFGLAYFNDALIYASTGNPVEEEGGKSKNSDKISLRTGLGYSQFYMSVAINGSYGKGEEAIGLNNNKKMNQGTFSYDPISKYGYYTRCEGKDNNCYIYFAEFKNNKWNEKDRLTVESRKMPIGHPFITEDGRRIYFTSIMEGGYGKSDLWYMDKLPDGSWSRPINLGREVNTVGREEFPFVAGGYLFFSSDGHPGFGGLDLFASKIDGNTHGEAINLGKPFNTFTDDFNLIERSDLEEGLLVSGRRGDKTSDDVYRFKGFPSALTATGRVIDSVMHQGIPGAIVEVTKDGKIVEKLTANDSGRYSFYLLPDATYELSTVVLGFNPNKKTYKAPAERFGRATNWDLNLTSSEAFLSGVVTAFEMKKATKTSRPSRIDLGPQGGVNIVLYANGKQVKVVRTKPNGEYRFGDIKENTSYMVKTVQKGFFEETKSTSIGKIVRSTDFNKSTGNDVDLVLEKIPMDDIEIDNILYDLNKATLRPEAMASLDNLVVFLNKNRTLKIHLSAHTDSKGSAKSNLILSEKRAKSVSDYLVMKGINPARLSSKGYGKTQLIFPREKSEAEFQANRRTTFKVIGDTGESLYDTQMQVSESVSPGQSRPSYPTGGGSTGVSIAQPVNTGANAASFPFRVQLSAAKTLDLNKPDFNRIQGQFGMKVYAEEGAGIYRYFVGGFNTLDEAKAFADRIKSTLGIACFAKAK